MARTPRPSTARVDQEVLQTLSEFEPMSHKQYSEITGMDKAATSARLKRLWNAKVIHIAYYERQPDGVSGPPLPFYALGNVPDAPMPGPLPESERCAKYRSRLKTKNGGKGWLAMMKKKSARHKKRMKSDPAYAAKCRAENAKRMRAKTGAQPRIPSVKRIDPLLALMMGRKA